MEECEVCGKGSEDLFLVDIEGAQMAVCGQCSKGKRILQKFSERKETQVAYRTTQSRQDEYEVVEHYGRIIKDARDALDLPAHVLAERINEKESTLVRVEKEDALPDDRLARKLEKALGIRLMTRAEPAEGKHPSHSKNEAITLGDAALIKKDKKGS
ncbi:MAG: multiprotein bridging factor aMBF1 [Candidatus Marsarchaeota archaeon]|nr:multiprotein bridging factor aMBF1 [Candidatus Marsarchaeota archaeon]MCL5413203.1 multiprotein bridging factor aMBF1 [Candidatus Marsarchaeota archaeon]